MMQGPDRHALSLDQGLVQNHAPDRHQDHARIQGLALVQDQGIDPAQKVEAVQGSIVPHHVVGPVRDQEGDEGQGLVPEVRIITDTEGHVVDLHFPLGSAMLEVGITLKQAIAWVFLV